MGQHKWCIFSITFGIFLGTFVSDWLYFLTAGIIGLLLMIYLTYYENKCVFHAKSEGDKNE